MKWVRNGVVISTLFAMPVIANAQTAYIYFGHGLPGHDASPASNPDLPIDISVNSTCLVEGATANSFSGPFTVPPGSYNIAVSNADTAKPCSNPAAITGTINVQANDNATLIVGQNAAGQPTGYVLPLDLGPVARGQTRIIVANASSLGSVDFDITDANEGAHNLTGLAPGAFQSMLVPSGVVTAQLASGGKVLLGPGTSTLPNQAVLLAITTGSMSTGSFNEVGRYFLYVHP